MSVINSEIYNIEFQLFYICNIKLILSKSIKYICVSLFLLYICKQILFFEIYCNHNSIAYFMPQ